jgi:hypothetical protein
MGAGPKETRWLRWSVAFVWLVTGVSVLHPYYRQTGSGYLAPLGLPDWVMVVTCAFEIVLGLRVALGPASTWVTAVQIVLVLGFTAILGVSHPELLVNPFGMLTKNLPLLAVVGTAWLVEREGWSLRALWLLRAGVAVIWITEGIFPKILFQQEAELAMVRRTPLLLAVPSGFLVFMGVCEAASGAGVLLLRGRPYRYLLACQLMALVGLPLLAGVMDPTLWVHPFEPLFKNVPIIAATVMLLRHAAPVASYSSS